MTSVASYEDATTAGNYTLTHSGVTLGNWVNDYTSNPRLATEVQQRHNLWSTVVILDGSDPALVWDHEFTVYTESGSMHGFMNKYFETSNRFYVNRARPLRIQSGDTNSVVIDFGNCYFVGQGLGEPSSLLLHRAGMLKLKFWGTQTPTVII
jgi:hypothetical protein